jgi:hypothetical protein
MPLTDEFASILCKQLNKTVPAGGWVCSYGIGSGRSSVDLRGKLAGRPVYIEVELRRDEPLTNVVKLWRAIQQDSHTNEAILVHAFSGHYPPANSHRLNAEFIGKQMQDSCGAQYVPLAFRFRPRKGARIVGDYRRRAAISLASDIWAALQAVLPQAD